MVWGILLAAVAIGIGLGILKAKQGGWRTSLSGNATKQFGNSRLTVFSRDEGWKYCIADGPDDNDPFFSDAYPTEQMAREAGEDHILGNPSRHVSPREQRKAGRRAETKSMGPSLIAAELEKMQKAEESVARALAGAPKESTVANLKKSLLTRARATTHLHGQLIDSGYADEEGIESLSTMCDRYFELRRALDDKF